jgi:beta-glucosidase/6-phospho-beta-glucosidase/beta-galactosidase
VSDRPRLLATLEGYAVEGGLDGPGEPTTCYRATISLGRHEGPGEAEGLWRDYEQVLDLAAEVGLDGVRLGVEWARVEPHRGEVDLAALERYREVAAHARDRGLGVSVVLVDAVWPAWLGMEAWLLPWTVPHVIAHAQRVATSLDDALDHVVVFADANKLVVNGFLDQSAPPWRRGASHDAASARRQIEQIMGRLREDPTVGPRLVGATRTISLDLAAEEIARQRAAAHCQEIYVRALVKGSGPSAAPAGLLERRDGRWAVAAPAPLLDALR